MTLQQLKYADAVAECGSLSETARQMFVMQPTRDFIAHGNAVCWCRGLHVPGFYVGNREQV